MSTTSSNAAPADTSGRTAWCLVAIVLLSAALVRGRLLEVPLERDEGEYAYAGQLILQGVPPYRFAYNMKLPGTYASYAGLMAVFGQSPAGIHLGLLAVNAVTIVLVYLLARRLFGLWAGVVAAATYARLSIDPGVLGFAAHATHFVTVFAVGGFLALLAACDSGRRWQYFASGLLLGTSLLMKQHGALFVAYGAVYAGWREWQKEGRTVRRWAGSLGAFVAGAVVPFGLTCVLLFRAGVFDRFWFWTITYAREYATLNSAALGWMFFREAIGIVIGATNLPLWLLAAYGLVLTWRTTERRTAVFVTGWLLVAFLTVCPGLYFRGHYFVVMLPGVAVLAGAAVGLGLGAFVRDGWSAGAARNVLLAVFAAAFLSTVYQRFDYLFRAGPEKVCETSYRENPFVAAVEISRYIRDRTAASDRVAVIGSEPEIYFYTGRRSATGYIYAYPLVEQHPFAEAMQRDMIAEIEAARPAFIVTVLIPASGLSRETSIPLTRWADEYCRNHYDRVGVIESDDERGVSYWDDAAAGRTPTLPYVVSVFRRKD